MEHQNLSQAEYKLVFTTEEVEKLGIVNKFPLPKPVKCQYCGKVLYYEAVVLNRTVIKISDEPQQCTCEKANADRLRKIEMREIENAKAEKKRQEQIRINKIERILIASGIKKRFIGCTFDNFKITNENQTAFLSAKKYADNFQVLAAAGKGIYFEGTCGTGKTHLATAIGLSLIKKEIPVICKTSIEMLSDIKSAYDKNDLTEKEILDVYKNIELLIIDDLGKEQCTSWTMAVIYSILNDRYENLKPTIITTNYNENMLITRLTPKDGDSTNIRAIISRLRECTEVITMAWTDYRSKKG